MEKMSERTRGEEREREREREREILRVARRERERERERDREREMRAIPRIAPRMPMFGGLSLGNPTEKARALKLFCKGNLFVRALFGVVLSTDEGLSEYGSTACFVET